MTNSKKIIKEKKESIKAGYIVLIIGLLILTFGILYYIQEVKSENWSKITAVIVSNDKYMHAVESKSDPHMETMLRIRYKYTIDGNKIYKSNFDKKANSKVELERLKEKYKKGKEIRIYYNPQKPFLSQRSVGRTLLPYFIFLIGGLVIIFGIIVIWLNSKYLKQIK